MARTAYELHAAAQEAAECGMHEKAARLLMEAADVALTEGGKRVLLEQAVDAAARACAEPDSIDDHHASAAEHHERAISAGPSKRGRRGHQKRDIVTNLDEFVRRTGHGSNTLFGDVFAGMRSERRRGRASATVLSTSGPLMSTAAADACRATLIFRPVERGRHRQAKR
jgi:hypothetical protein